MSFVRRVSATAAATLALGLVTAAPAAAAPGTDTTALRNAVTVAGIESHLDKLQAIADANNGTRASGTDGFDASADYVAGALNGAGYKVSVLPFRFPQFTELAPLQVQRTAPTPRTYGPEDVATMEYSGSGTASGTVQSVDLTLPPTPQPSSTSGCEAADFAGFTRGNIALIQRGTCEFRVKAANAIAAGATAVVIFNEGQEGRTDVFGGTLGAPLGDPVPPIPVISMSFEAGNELAGLPGAQLTITTSTQTEIKSTANVIADTPTGRTDRTIVVGAHLDSVIEGPGINDNGSGIATILEIALQLRELNIQPVNTVRFAFWGAEESGLLGSEHYVSTLSARDRKNIALNLNFDMVGSPNFVRFVYDGDGSATGTSGPNGSANIERVFTDYFAAQNLPVEPTAFDGRSDYGPFIEAGIPAGGLFSGAEEIKTPAQAAVYGGTAGVAFDACYHQECDTRANINTTALDQLGDAAAHATLVFAQGGAAVNGTGKGAAKGQFKGDLLRR